MPDALKVLATLSSLLQKMRLATDELLHICNFLQVKQLFQGIIPVCSSWRNAIETDTFYAMLLGKLRIFFTKAEHIGIQFDAPQQYQELLGIQNGSKKKLFIATMQSLARKVQQKRKVQLKIEKDVSQSLLQSLGRTTCRRRYGTIFCDKYLSKPAVSIVGKRPVPVASEFFIAVKGFKVHPDAHLTQLTVQFSVDNFANMCHFVATEFAAAMPKNYVSKEITGLLHSYYHKFMVLSVKYPTLLLVPSPDILACWYSHMIRPILYQAYCKILIDTYGAAEHAELFKRRHYVVPSTFYLNQVHMAIAQPALEQTLKLWQKEFGQSMYLSSIDVPEWSSKTEIMQKKTNQMDFSERQLLAVSLSTANATKMEKHYAVVSKNTESMLNIDASMVLQDLKFFTKVNSELKQFSLNENHMPQVVKSYERYLYFLTKHTDYAPSYLIDLAWHTHMCIPVAYIQDTCSLFGQVLDHDPTYEPTNEDIQQARLAWKKEFNTVMDKDHVYSL